MTSSKQFTPTGGQTIFPRINFLKTFASRLEQRIANGRVAMFFQRLFRFASLDLNFASSKSLVDSVSNNNLITFSRASSGTYVGSDGLIRTSPVNLYAHSGDLTNGVWQKNNSSISANAGVTPSNVSQAFKLVNDNFVSGNIIRSISGLDLNTAYTESVFLKQVDANWKYAFVWFNNGSGSGFIVEVDLESGTSRVTHDSGLTSPYTDISHTLESYGNGWYRVSLTATTKTATGVQLRIYPSENPHTDGSFGTQASPGDGTSGILIAGPQFEEGTTATDYIPTGATIGGAPRFDHDPVTGESLGLLIEKERTNYFPYSASFSLFNTLTTTPAPSQGFTAPDGSTDAYQYPINSTDRLQSNRTVPAGQTHTLSFFAKQGDGTNLSGYNGFSSEGQKDPNGSIYNWTTGVLQSGWTKEDYANGWSRFYKSYTSTTGTLFVLYIDNSGGVLLWGFQLELDNSFPTSYIPTTTSAVTRSPDIASIEGTNFSSWFNQSEGTVFAEVAIKGVSGIDAVFAIGSNGDADRWLQHYFQGVSVFYEYEQESPPAHSYTTGTFLKSAIGRRQGDNAVGLNGAIVQTDSYSGTYTPEFLKIGVSGDVNRRLNGHIKRLAYFPTRRTDQELIDLTS